MTLKSSPVFTSIMLLCAAVSVPCVAEDSEVLPVLLHDALAASLAENSTRVASVRSVVEQDESEIPEAWSGLLDDLVALEIVSSNQSPRAKAELLTKHARQLNDPVARERMLVLANCIEDYRFDELARKRKRNRVFGLINRAWRTTSQTLAGQPRALGVAAVDVFYSITGRREPSPAEKKIAYLGKVMEKRGTASPEELEKARHTIAKVKEKESEALSRQWKQKIRRADEMGDLSQVERLSGVAAKIWPEEPWFQERLKETRHSSRDSLPTIEFAALTDADRAKLGFLRDELAKSERPTKVISDHAARDQIADAMAERRSRTLDYLIFGNTRINDPRIARTLAAQGTDAPATLGILQGVETAIRGVSLLFKNELGLQQAIDAYAYADRETPGALTEKDYLKWAHLYAETGDYASALNLLKNKGFNEPIYTEKYRKKWASSIVRRCKDLPPSRDRFRALTFVLEELGDTRAAGKARDLLEEAPATERPLTEISTADLRDHSKLAASAGLRFDKAWWDGIPENGETEADRIFWDPEGVLWYRVEKKSPWRRIEQDHKNLPNVKALFNKLEGISVARALAEKRRGKPILPVEIEGGFGSETYLTPKLVQYDLSADDDWLFE